MGVTRSRSAADFVNADPRTTLRRLCHENAARTRVRLSELAAASGLEEREAMTHLDELADSGLLLRELELPCPHCGRPYDYYSHDEPLPPLAEATHAGADGCDGVFLILPKHLKVVYTATERLLDPDVVAGPRSRLGSLAEGPP